MLQCWGHGAPAASTLTRVEHLWTNMDQTLRIVSNTLMEEQRNGAVLNAEGGWPLNNKVHLLEWDAIHPMVIFTAQGRCVNHGVTCEGIWAFSYSSCLLCPVNIERPSVLEASSLVNNRTLNCCKDGQEGRRGVMICACPRPINTYYPPSQF